MKKLPQIILVLVLCLLTFAFSFWASGGLSRRIETQSKTQVVFSPEPKSKPEPQPEKPKSNTHTRSPSVACSADGKTVYWTSNDEKYNEIEMYKSEDGGKTWVKINLYIPGDPNDPYDESTYISAKIEDPFEKAREASKKKREAVPIPRNGK